MNSKDRVSGTLKYLFFLKVSTFKDFAAHTAARIIGELYYNKINAFDCHHNAYEERSNIFRL